MSKHRAAGPRHDARRGRPAARMGTRLRHRERGNALVRHGTRGAVIGGLALTAAFGMLAYQTTQAQNAARAAARARLVADGRDQIEIEQTARARVRAQQQAAARTAKLAQLAALRTAQANLRARQRAAVAVATVATSVPTSALSLPSPTSASAPSTPVSAPSPAASPAPSVSASPPVASAGGS
jgi:hypothetical protein